MGTEKQVNEIARRFGMLLINSGTTMMRSAFDLKPKVYLSSDIQDKLKIILGIPANQNANISCADGKYNVIDWETWEWIKDLDLLDQMIWIENFHDCDNFAFHFSSRASTFYLLNSCGVCFGRIYDDSGKWIGNHAFNIIATDSGNGLEFMIYEPMNDQWKKMAGKRTRLDFGWNYEPDWVIFF